MLATTGTDSSGAWIATGLLTGAGAVLLGVRRAMRKRIS
jgi:LPXTG-motif cell wall-anchored protein